MKESNYLLPYTTPEQGLGKDAALNTTLIGFHASRIYNICNSDYSGAKQRKLQKWFYKPFYGLLMINTFIVPVGHHKHLQSGSVSLKGVLYLRKQGDKMNQAWLGKTLASVCVRESECISSCRQCLGEFGR